MSVLITMTSSITSHRIPVTGFYLNDSERSASAAFQSDIINKSGLFALPEIGERPKEDMLKNDKWRWHTSQWSLTSHCVKRHR